MENKSQLDILIPALNYYREQVTSEALSLDTAAMYLSAYYVEDQFGNKWSMSLDGTFDVEPAGTTDRVKGEPAQFYQPNTLISEPLVRQYLLDTLAEDYAETTPQAEEEYTWLQNSGESEHGINVGDTTAYARDEAYEYIDNDQNLAVQPDRENSTWGVPVDSEEYIYDPYAESQQANSTSSRATNTYEQPTYGEPYEYPAQNFGSGIQLGWPDTADEQTIYQEKNSKNILVGIVKNFANTATNKLSIKQLLVVVGGLFVLLIGAFALAFLTASPQSKLINYFKTATSYTIQTSGNTIKATITPPAASLLSATGKVALWQGGSTYTSLENTQQPISLAFSRPTPASLVFMNNLYSYITAAPTPPKFTKVSSNVFSMPVYTTTSGLLVSAASAKVSAAVPATLNITVGANEAPISFSIILSGKQVASYVVVYSN